MDTPKKQIPPERKALYYGGIVLTGIGLLLFLSTFVTFMANFGNFENFEGRAKSEGFRALGGMILMMIGSFLMNVGANGWAGSGVILDPEKAREDVEPWSRMGGGIVKDALSEVNAPKPQVKVRCRQCQTLNEETAKFCNQCGSPV